MAFRENTMQIALGLLLTVVAINLNQLFMGSAVKGLNFGLLVSFFAWVVSSPFARPRRRGIFPLYIAAIIVQAFHFLEEYVTGFYTAFPGLFGAGWTSSQFITFNLVWLLVFIVAAIGVRKNIKLALLAAWFLGLVGGIGNGLLHVFLSLRAGGYFPGTLTAVLAFPVGIALVVALVRKSKKNYEF